MMTADDKSKCVYVSSTDNHGHVPVQRCRTMFQDVVRNMDALNFQPVGDNPINGIKSINLHAVPKILDAVVRSSLESRPPRVVAGLKIAVEPSSATLQSLAPEIFCPGQNTQFALRSKQITSITYSLLRFGRSRDRSSEGCNSKLETRDDLQSAKGADGEPHERPHLSLHENATSKKDLWMTMAFRLHEVVPPERLKIMEFASILSKTTSDRAGPDDGRQDQQPWEASMQVAVTRDLYIQMVDGSTSAIPSLAPELPEYEFPDLLSQESQQDPLFEDYLSDDDFYNDTHSSESQLLESGYVDEVIPSFDDNTAEQLEARQEYEETTMANAFTSAEVDPREMHEQSKELESAASNDYHAADLTRRAPKWLRQDASNTCIIGCPTLSSGQNEDYQNLSRTLIHRGLNVIQEHEEAVAEETGDFTIEDNNMDHGQRHNTSEYGFFLCFGRLAECPGNVRPLQPASNSSTRLRIDLV